METRRWTLVRQELTIPCCLTCTECCIMEKCCYCINLRVGCFVIAGLSITVWIAIGFILYSERGWECYEGNGARICSYFTSLLLTDEIVRLAAAIMLIVGCVRQNYSSLCAFLILWLLLFPLMAAQFALYILMLDRDALKIAIITVYMLVRWMYFLWALAVVNSYRVQLLKEELFIRRQAATPDGEQTGEVERKSVALVM